MIINVSGRTDIVNYYSDWFINRIDEGYVYTRNPFNKNQILNYKLDSSVVDTLTICSKNYRPILNNLPDIISKFNTFYYYTITSYDEEIEPEVPSIDESIDTLIDLSDLVDKQRVAWRFDPLLLTKDYSVSTHIETFEHICHEIHDYCEFAVFSFVDMYQKLFYNMPEIIDFNKKDKIRLIKSMGEIAAKYNLPIQSCAMSENYLPYNINNSGCITTDILEKTNNIKFKSMNTSGKRINCKCIEWRDIGEYNTCLNGCKYCYANKNPEIAIKNNKKHDKTSPLLIGNVEEDDVIVNASQRSYLLRDSKQTTLF